MTLKSYFDGGNHADSTKHDVVTLAAVSGTVDQWQPLEQAWNRVMKESGVGRRFHTTDLVTLNRPFRKDDGWTEARRDKLLDRCVSLIDPHIARAIKPGYPGKIGIYPFTVTVPLAAHKLARAENSNVPNNANGICAIQALVACLEWGAENMKTDSYHLVFDRGEPFKGHAEDRTRNKKAIQEFPVLKRIALITEANSADTIGLQVADLYAWCVSQKDKRNFKWQKRLLSLDRQDEVIPYELLIHPLDQSIQNVRAWKIQQRKPNP